MKSLKAILKGVCQYTLPLILVVCSLALKPEELGRPLSDIAPLMDARDYSRAVDKLNSYAKSSSETEQLAETYYLIGFIHRDYTHKYDDALKAYQRVIDLSGKVTSSAILEPYLALSKMSIAGIYRHIGQYENAVEIYGKVVADYPRTEYATVAIRNIKGIKDAPAEIELQRGIIDRFPGTELAAEAQFEIAELYRSIENLHNPERAIQEYTRLVDQYPNSRRAAEAQFKIGYVYSEIHRQEKAIAAYQKLAQNGLSADRLAAEALFQIGTIYYSELHNYQKAMDTFTRLLQNYPTHWKFAAGVYWRGMCYEQLGDYDNAISTYEMFVQLYPDEKPGWLDDIERHGDRNVKVRVQSKIQELKKLAPQAKWNQAEKLRSQGKYHETLSVYRELIGKYPGSQYSERVKSQIDRVTDLAEIQICREAIERSDVQAPALQYRIAEIYETKIHDYLSTIEEYEKVAKNYPDSYWAAEALYRTGFIYSGLEPSDLRLANEDGRSRERMKPDYQKAIGKYRQLIREYSDVDTAAKAYYQMGEIYRTSLKDYKRALEAYGKVASDYPRRDFYEGRGYKNSLADESQFKIGRIYYENLQNYDVAIQVFTEFLNDFPDSCRKAAAYSFIAAIHEKRDDRETSADYLERTIDIIVESDVQSTFFVRDALHNISRNQLSGFELQRDIIKQLRMKTSQLRARTVRQ